MSTDDELIEAFESQMQGAGDMLRIAMDEWPKERAAAIAGKVVDVLRDAANELETFLRNEESLRRLRDEAAKREE